LDDEGPESPIEGDAADPAAQGLTVAADAEAEAAEAEAETAGETPEDEPEG
jgi:hypothetical protein